MKIKPWFIPYIPDLRGIEIPQTDRKLQPLHILLYGLILALDNDDGCYASREYLAKKLGVSENKVRDLRSDLLRCNLLSAEKNKYGEITKLKVNSFELPTPTDIQSNVTEHSIECHGTFNRMSREHSFECLDNRDATSVLKESNNRKLMNKNLNTVSPATPAQHESTKSYSSKEKASMKNGTVSPFDEEVVAVSVRPDKVQTQADQDRRRNYAVANRLYKRFNVSVKPSKVAVKRIGELLDVGWAEEKIISLVEWATTDEFYSKTPTIQAKLASDAVEKYEFSLKNNRTVECHYDAVDDEEDQRNYVKYLMPEEQRERMRQWCRENGKEIPEEYNFVRED